TKPRARPARVSMRHVGAHRGGSHHRAGRTRLEKPMTTEPSASVGVPLRQVEYELSRQIKALQGGAESPVHRACMSNLGIYCDQHNQAVEVAAQVPHIVAAHPARVLLAIDEPGASASSQTGDAVEASVLVRRLAAGRHDQSYSEQVTLRAANGAAGKLAFA